MQSSEVYVTIGFDKQGTIVEVKVDGRVIEERKSTEGMELIDRKMHELLTYRSGAADAVAAVRCIRDPITGRIWCW
jgi:hypothetical protein